MAMATQATLFSPSSLSSTKTIDPRLTSSFKQPSALSFASKPASRLSIRAAAAEGKAAETTEAAPEAPKGFTPPELDPNTPSPIFAGSTGGLLRKAQVEEFYVITWESPKEQIFEMPTGGAAIMREGPNLLKLARKEQCLALGTRLRSKYKIKYQFYRVFPNGEVQYLHPKDGVYPEKVNPGRQGVGQNMRSIGKNVSPIEVNPKINKTKTSLQTKTTQNSSNFLSPQQKWRQSQNPSLSPPNATPQTSMALRNGGLETAHTQEPAQEFRALVEKADRKFSRVRDLPAFGPGPNPARYLNKVFKAYMKVWKFQRENRAKLVGSGLQRWEIGEIASRIGQLYFGQYMRSSEARFLLESYVFYEAIFNRGYFQGGKEFGGVSVRFKELRFYARFLLVALILNRRDVVDLLVDRFKVLVDDSRATFRETNFKEWKQVVQEIVRFVNVDKPLPNARPLRYCAMFDTHPDSLPYVARFHAKKVLKLKDVVLTSYHRNEVKFAEVTLDTYRMLQCLEWEPSGSFYQKHQTEPIENGVHKDFSGTSGLIDINLAADLTDPTLPPNPRKAVLYRPTVTQFISVIATMCEELPPDSIILIYVSSSLGAASSVSAESSGGSRRFSKSKVLLSAAHDQTLSPGDNKKGYLSNYYDNSLCLSPRGIGGSNNLYPGDLLPFTRRPLFLVIDSDNSHAFKVIHGSERGEPSALLLSPSRPSFKNPPSVDAIENGSQFTLFLTTPLLAFCQLVGLSAPDRDTDIYGEAENIIANAFAKWEVMLCSSTKIDLVWAQVLPDPFLRRIILRFIFCRAVLYLLHPLNTRDSYMPDCLPHLPGFLSPDAEAVESYIHRLADHLKVSDCFYNT